jgi:trehalose synthase
VLAGQANQLQERVKSLAEGFGLTVAEAMWKARPVVASRIGGIQDQIEDGVSGVLLDVPSDRQAFVAAVCRLLTDPDTAARISEAAKARVKSEFLGSRHLAKCVEVCAQLI